MRGGPSTWLCAGPRTRTADPTALPKVFDFVAWARPNPERKNRPVIAAVPTMRQVLNVQVQQSSQHCDIGAVLVDSFEFTLSNMRYGFEAGDAALRAMVRAHSLGPRGLARDARGMVGSIVVSMFLFAGPDRPMALDLAGAMLDERCIGGEES